MLPGRHGARRGGLERRLARLLAGRHRRQPLPARRDRHQSRSTRAPVEGSFQTRLRRRRRRLLTPRPATSGATAPPATPRPTSPPPAASWACSAPPPTAATSTTSTAAGLEALARGSHHRGRPGRRCRATTRRPPAPPGSPPTAPGCSSSPAVMPTGYDNTDLLSGEPDSEVYLYDAAAGSPHLRLLQPDQRAARSARPRIPGAIANGKAPTPPSPTSRASSPPTAGVSSSTPRRPGRHRHQQGGRRLRVGGARRSAAARARAAASALISSGRAAEARRLRRCLRRRRRRLLPHRRLPGRDRPRLARPLRRAGRRRLPRSRPNRSPATATPARCCEPRTGRSRPEHAPGRARQPAGALPPPRREKATQAQEAPRPASASRPADTRRRKGEPAVRRAVATLCTLAAMAFAPAGAQAPRRRSGQLSATDLQGVSALLGERQPRGACHHLPLRIRRPGRLRIEWLRRRDRNARDGDRLGQRRPPRPRGDRGPRTRHHLPLPPHRHQLLRDDDLRARGASPPPTASASSRGGEGFAVRAPADGGGAGDARRLPPLPARPPPRPQPGRRIRGPARRALPRRRPARPADRDAAGAASLNPSGLATCCHSDEFHTPRVSPFEASRSGESCPAEHPGRHGRGPDQPRRRGAAALRPLQPRLRRPASRPRSASPPSARRSSSTSTLRSGADGTYVLALEAAEDVPQALDLARPRPGALGHPLGRLPQRRARQLPERGRARLPLGQMLGRAAERLPARAPT